MDYVQVGDADRGQVYVKVDRAVILMSEAELDDLMLKAQARKATRVTVVQAQLTSGCKALSYG